MIGTYLYGNEGAVIKVSTEGLVVHNAADELLIILDIHFVLIMRDFLACRPSNLMWLFVLASHRPICFLLTQDFCSIFHRCIIYLVFCCVHQGLTVYHPNEPIHFVWDSTNHFTA